MLVACQGAETTLTPAKGPKSADGSVVRPGSRDPKTGKYIPPTCAGDGSYEKAVDCFRRAEVIRFRTPEGQGTMTRETPGREHMMLYLAKGDLRGTWMAETRASGVAWTFNGARAVSVPPQLDRLFQRVTLFPDPQKKEGAPKLLGRDEKGITWEFTDKNSGDRYVVRVDPKSGHMAQVTMPGMDLTFG